MFQTHIHILINRQQNVHINKFISPHPFTGSYLEYKCIAYFFQMHVSIHRHASYINTPFTPLLYGAYKLQLSLN